MAEAAPPFGKIMDIAKGSGAPAQRSLAARLRFPLMVVLPALVVIGAVVWWRAGGATATTDNAYVKQDVVSVSGEVAGPIASVSVRENQLVNAGDVLFTIDPAPFRIALAKANADLASAQVRLGQLRTDFAASAVDIAGSRPNIQLAEAELARQRELAEQGFTTKARVQAAENALENAQWHARQAQADALKARAALASGDRRSDTNPQIELAMAERAKAELDLARTVVRAPVAGRISQAGRLHVGQMAIAALPMVSIVVADRSWIEANFKESQLERMAPGQPAIVRVDAYPGLELKAHVQSIGAGTGSVFSVLPAQNATGNWVKVIQRVPVRIVLDQQPPRPLIAGLSADVTVDVRSVGQR